MQIKFNGKTGEFSNGTDFVAGTLLGFDSHIDTFKGSEKSMLDVYLQLGPDTFQVSFTLYTWSTLFLLNKLRNAEVNLETEIKVVMDKEQSGDFASYSLLVKQGEEWLKNKTKYEDFGIPKTGDKTEKRNIVIITMLNKLPKYTAAKTDDLPF